MDTMFCVVSKSAVISSMVVRVVLVLAWWQAKWVVPPEILGILFGQRFGLGSKLWIEPHHLDVSDHLASQLCYQLLILLVLQIEKVLTLLLLIEVMFLLRKLLFQTSHFVLYFLKHMVGT
ncbi:hypothetical protein J1N35_036582 [Gossypium stocksii]|uniref:Uncharacterized protein n=1 Tax=Gossypium stocksii TaxID=47602 RepID=A0A9D3ZKT7_9ROSI|nr:hypothetical protein J1N35_036582 [Gossypium stocksii]